jgi:Zn-dependent peptidase ImmA (M78 family)
MKKDVKEIAEWYMRKFGTKNPFKIAKELKVLVKTDNLGDYSGCYMYLNRHRCIFLNSNLDENERCLVMAHELGHAILHRTQNCYFIRNKTYLLCSRIEREANIFAVNLLISDDELKEYESYTIDQLSMLYGLDRKLIELRLEK